MKKTVLLLGLLLIAFTMQAQTKLVFEETVPEAYLMRYAPPANSGSQANLNSILELLEKAGVSARTGGRPSRKPEFTLRLEHQARITDLGDKLQLQVQLKKVSVNGDVHHKGFDLGEVLVPEELKFKVKLLNGKNELVREFTNQRVLLRGSNSSMLEVSIPDTAAAQNYKLKIEEKQVQYTAADVNRVKERLGLIRDYYAADATVQRVMEQATRVLPDDLDRITLHDRSLQELEKHYAQLKGQLAEKLNLEQNDPQRLNHKLKQLHQVLQDRRRAINYTLATLDQQFFNRGVSLANNGNYTAAQAYFMKSIEANPMFAPAHVQLARLDLVNGYTREATHRLRDVLTRMRIDPETEAIAMGLAHDVYVAHISSGNSLTMRGAYHEALEAYEEARELCSTIGGLRCNMTALNDGEARAATGAYRAIVDNGKRLLSRNELAEAERTAEEALNFQHDYDYVLNGDQEATELLSQVKFQYYLQHIDQGKRYLSQNNHRAALDQFEAALELERQYTFMPVQELGQLARKAAKPVLLARLSQGYEEAMQNRLASARTIASDAVAMQERFALQSDTEVQRKYKLLRERIFTQECINTQAIYDKHFQNAKELVQEKKFIAADHAYQAAIKAADEKAECGIATFTAKDGRETIAPAANYQRKLEDVDRLVNRSRYAEAIQLYNEAEKHYLTYQVGKFGLNHTSLFNYAKSSRKQAFTAAAVDYYTGLGEEQVAIQLLASLLDNGYRKGKTKKVQEQLGRQLAMKDAGALAAIYAGNRDLRKMRKAFEKERKRIERNG
ncbi:MAG: hypothetical protein LPK14_10820 [Hymenobacteraceae bacterium]|nr:hypothetical protein [Hymenobacteraceae bacterium]